MKKVLPLLTLCAAGLGIASCARITSQVVEKPRVDQEVSGNQGYLVGSGPVSAAPRSKTRQVIETNIELPTAQELNPWRVRKSKSAAFKMSEPAPPAMEMETVPLQEEAPRERLEEAKPAVSRPMKGYVVKKGDTLEKIAAREYGDSRKWRLIYEANKDRLRGPNQINAGQKLMIPAAPEETRHRASSDLK